jgi:hypothetical protein
MRSARRAALDNLTRAGTLDRYGRARDWQHLAQFRSELAQAEAWAAFLNAQQESWQLRVRGLRENDTALADQAMQLDQAATMALMEAMRSATPGGHCRRGSETETRRASDGRSAWSRAADRHTAPAGSRPN